MDDTYNFADDSLTYDHELREHATQCRVRFRRYDVIVSNGSLTRLNDFLR